MDRVYIFDTTLRDGEQSSGVNLLIKEKLDIAKQLAKLGVDVIEAGFPVASADDFEAVKVIASEIEDPTIAALARVLPGDIERAAEALKSAKKKRIHVFLATSKIHMEYKLRKPKEDVIKMATEGVRLAKSFCDDIEFSPEDASRSERSFLYEVITEAINAGATTINIPDTVGYSIPPEFGELILKIRENVPNIDKVVISVHCHNDLGLAVANSLSAIKNGARQVECTINGIGERAGNAALEEIVVALKTRQDLFGLTTNIDTRHLYKTSRMVSLHTGMVVQPNKAVVGANAFSHSSGIHQDGFLKESTTYEILKPRDIGVPESKIVLTKLSGRHALKRRLENLGFKLTEDELKKAFLRFKELACKKNEVFDEDIEALIEDEIRAVEELVGLEYIHVVCGNNTVPTATVRVKRKDEVVQEAACGNGPVDAVYRAIDKCCGIECSLRDYSVSALTGEKDAVGEVTVKIESSGTEVVGRGMSTDIIEASAKAYISAINRLYKTQNIA
ncbi:TPA: 2-isopropylmalate synthase [bacterium]|nr:2-isopropylmalate synthase [bacterium]